VSNLEPIIKPLGTTGTGWSNSKTAKKKSPLKKWIIKKKWVIKKKE
jgi:hypothetical protein